MTRRRSLKLTFVAPWFGGDIPGGAEAATRGMAQHLGRAGYPVEVLTTCALAYDTWKNHYPAGESVEGGVKIKRFAVDSPRHFPFKPVDLLLRHAPLRMPRVKKAWMRMQGPYSSGLIRYVADNEGVYDGK